MNCKSEKARSLPKLSPPKMPNRGHNYKNFDQKLILKPTSEFWWRVPQVIYFLLPSFEGWLKQMSRPVMLRWMAMIVSYGIYTYINWRLFKIYIIWRQSVWCPQKFAQRKDSIYAHRSVKPCFLVKIKWTLNKMVWYTV